MAKNSKISDERQWLVLLALAIAKTVDAEAYELILASLYADGDD